MFGIDDAITAGSNLIGKILDKVAPDADEAMKEKMMLALTEMQSEYAVILAQIATNTAEATNTNWFVSGWRPYVGWVCGSALAYSAIIEPFVRFIASVVFGYMGVFPVIDTTITSQVLMGMLGFGALRTVEKHSTFNGK